MNRSLGRYISLILVFALLYSILPEWETVQKTVQAAGNTYYIATTGSDTAGDGTETNPWKTIQKAADVMMAGDTCIIRGGTYRETVIPSNSGTASAQITYKAYGDEIVTISGCDAVSGWVQDNGSIFKADVAMALDHENQVFYNGDLILEARWPNSTDLFAPVLAIADNGTTSQYLYDTDLPDYDFTGATVWIHEEPAWSNYTQEVTSYGADFLNTDYNSTWTNHNLNNGSKYYVSGIKDALDTANEWYYDNLTSELYLWVTGGVSPGSGVEVKTRMNAFDLSGISFTELNGIHITAATIEFDETSSYITMDSLNLQYPYYSDKTLTEDEVENSNGAQSDKGLAIIGQGHVLKNSELGWSSGSGVSVTGTEMDIINNYIHDCNFIGTYASGLAIKRSKSINDETHNNTGGHFISHNTITRTGRSAMNIAGLYDSIVQYNDMSYVGYLTDDLGVVYGSFNEGGNSEIRYNQFSNNLSDTKSKGLYFDHGGQNFLSHHNISWNTVEGMASNHYALGMAFYNNTVTSTGEGGYGFKSYWQNMWPDDMYGSRFINNLLSQDIVCDGTDITITHNQTNYLDLINDKSLPTGSDAIDSGMVEPGITDGYLGDLPDKGALEKNGTDWTIHAGHDFTTPPTITSEDRQKTDYKYWNKIKNSAFELGSMDEWSYTGSDVSMNYYKSSQSTPLTNSTCGGFWSVALGNGQNSIEQSIEGLLPDTTYELRIRLRADTGESARIGVKDFGGIEVISPEVIGNTPEWSDTRIRFTTGSTNTTATVYAVKSSSGPNNVYVDDTSVFLSDISGTIDDSFNTQTKACHPLGYDIVEEAEETGVEIAEIPSSTDLSMKLVDNSTTKANLVEKEFESKSGQIVWEFDLRPEQTDQYMYMTLLDGDGKTVIQIRTTQNGKIGYKEAGSFYETSATYTAGTFMTLRITADTATGTYNLAKDGVSILADKPFVNSAAELSRVRFSTSKSPVGTYYIDNVQLRTKLLSANFDNEVSGATPSGFVLTENAGSVDVAEVPTSIDKSMKLYDVLTTDKCMAEKSFAAVSGKVIWSFDLRPEQTDQFMYMTLLDSTGVTAVQIRLTSNGKVGYKDGATFYETEKAYTKSEEIQVKIEADTTRDEYSLYINGTALVMEKKFANTVTDLAQIRYSTANTPTGTHYIDDIIVYH